MIQMEALLFGFFVLVVAGVQAKDDPCTTNKEINNPYRSTSYKWTSGNIAICDNHLKKGWYRFTSIVGGMIPTTKPKPYHCGTVAPIWINGPMPTKKGQTINTIACVNMFDMKNGCVRKHQISVKHCGNYFVYFLVPARGCTIAYCAGNLTPCPRGMSGISPHCQVLDIVDIPYNLIPTPKITYLDDNSPEVKMLCKFDFPQWNNVSFLVEWFSSGRLFENQTICTNADTPCKERQSILSHDDYGRPGERVRCGLRMKYLYAFHPDNKYTSVARYSPYYYIGITVSPLMIYTKECDKSSTADVTLRATVPLVPMPGIPNAVRIRVYVPSAFENQRKQAAVSRCDLPFRRKDTMLDKNITIKALCDYPDEPENNLQFHFAIEGAHTFWVNYRLKSVKVKVNNTEIGICTANGDPHYTTFDKKYFDFYKIGDYVMYRSVKETKHVEIHSRLWSCNENAACNCGVAIREDNDIIILTVCNKDLSVHELALTEFNAHIPRPLSHGTHVYRTIQGSSGGVKYKVTLASGTQVVATRTLRGMDVEVKAPKPDRNKVSGLCGNFNGNGNDDFQNNGQVFNNSNSFGESLKIDRTKSLFEVTPNFVERKVNDGRSCICPSKGKVQECFDTADRFKGYTSSNHEEDITEALNKFGKKIDRRSVDTHWYTDDIIDYEDRSFFVDEKDAQHAIHRFRSRRSTRIDTKMSKENATRFCKKIIEDSTAGKICKGVPGMDLTNAMLQCVTDLQLTGDKTFADAAFDYMKSQCEMVSLKNMSLYSNNSNGEMVPPMEIGGNLCPNDCSEHGNCSNRACICDEGFTALDCSMDVNAVPELFGIYDGGLCDIRERPCKKTDIFGQDFINSDNMTCHIKEFKVFSGNWSPRTSIIKLRGKMTDLFVVKCKLPDPPTILDSYENEGTPAGGLLISVSNDGIRTSKRQLKFVSYDSVCLNCSKLINCTLKDGSCIIRGHCFAALQPNPRDWCKQCIPSDDQYSWTTRKGNHAPKFTSNQTYYAIYGEYLSLQLFSKDRDMRPVTYSILSSTATNYTFISTGLLRWKVTSKHKFTFKVTDECGLFDTIEITVRIVQCPCLNGGTCVPYPFHPRGSGLYNCNCIRGFIGAKCGHNVDDCIGVNCGQGTCIDGLNNFTCRCHVGFKGSQCDQREILCTNHSCFTGVQCTDINGNISCGPCPPGYSGDGKTCLVTQLSTTPETTTLMTTAKAPTTLGQTNSRSSTTEKTTTYSTTEMETSDSFTTQAKETYPTTKMETSESFTTQAKETYPTTKMETSESFTTQAKERIRIEFRILQDWSEGLKDTKSVAFINLARTLKNEVLLTFERSKNLVEVEILSFRKGSVIAEMALIFQTRQDDHLQPLRNKIKDKQMGSLRVDPASLKIINDQEDDENPTKLPIMIPILVSTAVAVVVIVVITLVVLKMKKHPGQNVVRKQSLPGPKKVLPFDEEKHDLEMKEVTSKTFPNKCFGNKGFQGKPEFQA